MHHEYTAAAPGDDDVDFEALRTGPSEDSPVLDFTSPLSSPRPSAVDPVVIRQSAADVRALSDEEIESMLGMFRQASDSAREQRTRAIGLEDRLSEADSQLEWMRRRIEELTAEKERAMAEKVVLESRASAAAAEKTQALLRLADFHEVRTALSLATGMLEELMPTDFRVSEFEDLLSRVGEVPPTVQPGPRPTATTDRLPLLPRVPDSSSRPDTGVVLAFPRRPASPSPESPGSTED